MNLGSYQDIRQSSCKKEWDRERLQGSEVYDDIAFFLSDKHEVAMKFMKYNMQPPHLMQGVSEHTKDFNGVHETGTDTRRSQMRWETGKANRIGSFGVCSLMC